MWVEENNGKYKCCEKYKDPMTGKWKKVSVTVTDKKRKTLKAAEKTLEGEIEKKTAIVPERKQIRFGELVDLYLEYQQENVKESTYKSCGYTYHILAGIVGQDVLIENLNTNYLEIKIKKYSSKPSVRNHYIDAVKTLLRWAERKDYVGDAGYLRKLEPFKEKPRREKIQDKFLEPEELRELIDALPDERYQLVTRFLALSGLRFGEMAALTKKDVDFDAGVIHVTKTYSPGIRKTLDTPKTFTSERDVFLQPELWKLCKEILQFTRIDSLAGGYRTDLFISSIHGTNLINGCDIRYLYAHIRDRIEKLGSAHTLRHTHTSLLAAEGVSLDAISRRLGHEDSNITRRVYLHVTEKLKERDNAQIAKIQIF
ncbi:MAG: site-specific integrase [Clostridiales bacterium]|nr:site-specific integrase [Clostridiales bacterium]